MLSVPVRSKFAQISIVLAALTVMALVLFNPGSALGQADTFLNGDGHDGAVTIGVTGTATAVTPNAVAPVSGAVAAGATTVTYGTVRPAVVGANTTGNVGAGFAVNRLVLVYQSNGTTGPGPTSGTQTAYPLSSSTAGHYEFARVQSLTGTVLTLTAPLIRSYAAGSTQVIAVPEYTTAEIRNAGTTVTAPAWNGASGGVVVVLASGAVTFLQAATVSANASGFRGGIASNENAGGTTDCPLTQYDAPALTTPYAMKGEGFFAAGFLNAGTFTATTQAGRGNYLNAGGGGNCFNAGGGGGGNGGQGGIGGNSLIGHTDGNRVVGGLGGAALTYSADSFAPMGGGGGAGERNDTNVVNGGAGGGVVMVRGSTLVGAGNFRANGGAGAAGNVTTGAGNYPDGAGGGGAGGVVQLRFTGAAACGSVQANGGVGGANITTASRDWTGGGGGAGGKTYVQGTSGTCVTAGSSATGGAAGQNATLGNSGGAGAGGNGTTTQSATALASPTITISTPTASQYVSSATPAITGTSTSGATIYLYDGATFLGTTTAVGTAWSYTPSTLTNGSHTINAFAESGGINSTTASRTFTVDTIAPTVSLTVPANGSSTNDTTPAITFSVTEVNSGTTVCSVDGGATFACTSGSSLAALTPGSHTLFVRHTDLAGNIGTSTTNTFTVDTTAPAAPAITLPVAATTYTNNTSNTISGTAEAGSTVRVYDGATLIATVTATGGNWTTGAVTLAVGSHTITATATDAASNLSVASSSKTIIVDQTTPAAPVITDPAAATTYTADNTPTISGTAEANSTVNVFDGATNVGTATTDGSGNWSLPATSTLATGSHTITARATDQAGNQGVASASKTMIVDTTAPAVSLTAPANGAVVNTTTPTVTFTVTETNTGTTRCVVDGVLPGTVCASGSALAALTQGSHTITITHTDLAGNVGTSTTNTFTVDSVAPVAPNISTPATSPFPTNDTTPLLTGTAEINSTVRIYEGATLLATTTADGSGNWSVSTSALAVGSHTVIARSQDAAGNTSPDSTSKVLVIDTTAPTVNITAPLNAATVGPNGNATFTTSDAIGPVTTTCQVDTGTVTSCTSPYAYSGLSTGAHSITVVATDGAGNSATAVRNFTVDATPPNTTITGQPALVTNSTSATFTFTSTETPNTFECQIDANPIAVCTSGINYTGLAANVSHTFSVRAIDQYGNTDQTPATYTWTIDTTLPVAPTISTPGSDIVTSDTTPAIGGLAEANSTVRVYEGATLIGTATANGSGVWALSPDPTLSVGSHTLFATSTDGANNVSPNSTNRVIVIDTTAPTVTLTAPANGSSIATTTPAITFSVTDTNQSAASSCVIDGGTPVTCTSGFTTAALIQGSHTVYVTHTDLAGNVGTSATHTFTVDTNPPNAPTITGGPSAPVASTTAAFTFTGEPGGTYQCYIDSPVNWVNCTSGVSYSSLTQGAHTFHVRQTDAAGNISAESTRSWTVDTVGPPAPTVNGPTGTVGSSSASISFSDTEAPVTFMCRVDAVAYAACTSPVNISGLINGAHSYSVYAVDALGNLGTPTVINWIVDTSLFTTSITAGPTGTVATANNSLSFVATITSGTTYQCRVDGGAYALCTSPFSTGVLTNGPHTFDVYAVNGGDTTPVVSRAFTVDTTGPVITISAPAAAATVGPNGNVTFSATDSTGPITYTCQLDAGTATSCTSPFAYGSLSNGAHSVTIVATDAVSNSSTLVRDFTVDAVAPNTTITGQPAAVTSSTSATFTFTSTESPSTFQCQLDSNPAVACNSGTISFSSLAANTSHSFSVQATDQYGNTDLTAATYTWTIDTTAPVAPSINTPSGNIYTNDTTPPVAGLAEPDSTVRVYDGATLIGTATANGSGVWALSPDPTLAVGAHVLTATATDAANNVSPSSVSRTITVDTTSPTVTLTAPANGSTVTTLQPTITFSVTETNPAANSFCSIDGAAAISCTSGTATSPLTQGSHTVVVTHTDLAGNVGTSATHTFTVDTVGPPAPTVNGPSGTVALTTAAITFSDTEAPVTFRCSLDGAVATTCTSPVNLTGLGNGPHSYAVYAVDPFGNNSTTTTINWTVDTSLFVTSITAGPLGTVSTASNSLSFVATITSGTTYECRVDSGTFASCTSPFSTGTLPDGAHTFDVRATNGADTTPIASRAFTIDTAAPSLSITAPTNGATVGPNGSVTFTATDSTGPITYTCQIDSGTPVSCGSPFIFTGLSDGPHSVTVVATDNVGNGSTVTRNFIVDAVEPDTTITSAPDASTSSTSAQFSFTSSEPGSTFECQLDGSTLASCTSPINYSSLSQGSHSFQVRAIDANGNYDQSPASHIWAVDLTAPVAPSINTPAADAHTDDTTPAIAGLAEADSVVRVYDGATLIGTVTASGSGVWSLSPDPTLSEGPHNITATATDEAGNTGPASSIRVITIDTIDPEVTITSPTLGQVVSTDSPNITFTATDTNLDTVECSLDSGTAVSCTSPWPTSGLSEGLHSVSVQATDKAGNQTVATTTFSVDTAAPNAPVINTPAADLSTTNLRPTISGVAEQNSTITIYDDGIEVGTTTSNGAGAWTWTPSTDLTEEAHPFTVTSTDEGGNESDESNVRTITVDLTDPAAPEITFPAADGPTTDTTPTLGGTAEPFSTVKIYEGATLLGEATANGTGDWTYTPSTLSQGAHAFHATSTDAAGNVSDDSNIRTLTVDTTAPTSQITGHPDTRDNDTTPTFTFTSTDVTATFECSLNGSSFQACTSPQTLGPLVEGEYTFQVRAKDPAGNTESPAQSFTWTLDLTGPAKPVITSPVQASTTSDDTPTISGTAEANSTVEIFIDGNPVAVGTATTNGSGQWSFTSAHLSDGLHNVSATATDEAGNTGPAADTRVFTVDTTPPDGLVTPQTGTGGGTQPPTYDISTPDNTATIRCSVDGSPSAPCSSPFTPSGTFAPGTHTIVVTFTDPSGNVTTRTITFVIAGATVNPPVDPPANSDPTQCLGGGVVITNLFPKSGKTVVSGFARKDLIGKTVSITYKPTKKVVGMAVVSDDGSFTTTFKAPPKKDWNKNTTNYQASAGGFKSKWTKLLRRTSSTVASYTGGKLTVSGTVTLPLVKGGGATIKARTGCSGAWKTVGTTKFKSNGAFSLTSSYEGSGVIFVRVSAVIGNPSKKNSKFKTNSFIVPVIVK